MRNIQPGDGLIEESAIMGSRLRQILGYRPGTLGKNTLFGTTGLGARAVIQAVYLLIVSRWLGAEGYGLFAGSVALVILGAPLANWGSGLLLTRYISQDRTSSRAMWATALVQTGVIGGVLVFAALMVSGLLLQHRLPLLPMLLLALSELMLLPAVHAATSHCYALERGKASAVVMSIIPLGRTLAMLGAMFVGLTGTPGHAALAHFIGSAVGLLTAVSVIAVIDGLPAWRSRLPIRESIRQGTPYAISNLSGTSYQEVDKILILQILGATAVGTYTVSFRVAGIFVLPVAALIGATLPRLMALHLKKTATKTYRAVVLVALGYGLLASMGMLVAAPFIPYLFGLGYEESAHYLLLLAPWPALYSLRQSLATRLTTMHKQALRSTIEFLALAIVVVLNVLLLPRLGPEGAVIALLAAEFLAVLAMGVFVRRSHRTATHLGEAP